MSMKPAEHYRGHPISERVTGADLLGGLDFRPPPYPGSPVAAIVLVKICDVEGDVYWSMETSGGLTNEEIIGALTARAGLTQHWYNEQVPRWSTFPERDEEPDD